MDESSGRAHQHDGQEPRDGEQAGEREVAFRIMLRRRRVDVELRDFHRQTSGANRVHCGAELCIGQVRVDDPEWETKLGRRAVASDITPENGPM